MTIDIPTIRQQNAERKRLKKPPYASWDELFAFLNHARNDPVEETIEGLVSEIERLRRLEAIQGTEAELKQDVLDANERTAKILAAYMEEKAKNERLSNEKNR